MCRPNFLLRSGILASFVWSALALSSAEAVVVYNSSAINSVAPADDPGWLNVAYLGNGSAVYLGNRWVITANHLGDAPVRLSDGRTFPVTIGTDVTLNNSANSGVFGSPDLRMFQIATDPGLPTLNIGTNTPGQGNTVMMIGAGNSQLSGLTGWNVSSGSVWTQAPLSSAHQLGYSVIGSAALQMEWGVNNVDRNSLLAADQSTISFTTVFNHPGAPYEAQAVVGDSGGGVFQRIEGKWSLAGIMDSVQGIAGQPAATVAFGDQTFAADLANYRDQIVSLVGQPNSLWRNPLNINDVNHSGDVTPLDALVIINALRLPSGVPSLTGAPSATDSFLDVNGDGTLSSTDALQVINFLMSGTANSSAFGQSGVNLVPEPSSAVLALMALLGLAIARRLKSRP